MPQIAKVAVAAATYAIDKPYDYLIPQGTDIAVGMRVLAPFGRGNRRQRGSRAGPGAGGAGQTHQAHPVRGGPGARHHGPGDPPGPVDAGAVFLHVLRRHPHHPARRLCGTAIGRCGP